ncbi:MAG TPA: non-canonical purine NTP pyrophosphatase [Terriglobia bacterium]|nr:non-canonical purine NTP pyrophosphatase [Terriglobia bacterium]
MNVLTLWLASTNPGKLREFGGAAQARGVSVRPLAGLDRLPPCIEDGSTFEENAKKKAVYYSELTDGLVFADDSGLSVDALGGGPGVFSARFAGPQATDDENNLRLIAELRRALGTGGWDGARAHYVCVVALARRGQLLAVTEGQAEGVIHERPRGSGGFGYDPYFFYPPLGRTFAELSPEAKFAVSHRGEAFRKLLDAIDLSRDKLPGDPEPGRLGRAGHSSVII